jgi:hypothetical protein
MAIIEMKTKQFRVEDDSLGDVQVPADQLWGAQTQRSYTNFPIGVERFRFGVQPSERSESSRSARLWRMANWASFPRRRWT